MNAIVTSYNYILKLKNLSEQVRLSWSSYAALGTTLGACVSKSFLIIILGLFGLLIFFNLNKKYNCTNISVFTSCIFIAFSVNYYQTYKLLNFYENYTQCRFTLYGKIVDIDSLAFNPKQRRMKILVQQLVPNFIANNIPKFLTVSVNNTNQLQLHDQILISNLEVASFEDPALFRKNLLTHTPQVKLTADSDYRIIANTTSNLTLCSIKDRISQKIYQFKHWFITKLKFKLSATTFDLLATIFLGYKKTYLSDNNKQQIHQQFQIWGLAHFLARAGLHMIIIAFLIKLILLGLQVSTRLNSPAIISLALLYHQISWASTSFLRALHMVILYEFCKSNNWQIDGLHLLNLILICTLLSNPVQIFFLDFQLSFVLTYALVLAFRQNQYQIVAFRSTAPI